MLERIILNIHWIIILNTSYLFYTMYESHTTEMTSLTAEVPLLDNKLKRKTKEVNQLQNYFNDIQEAKARIELVAQEVERSQRQLPNEIEDAENLAIIKGFAEKINIKNIFLNPDTEENRGFYFAKHYNFKGTGTFLQFLIFLEKISDFERLFNIKSLRLDIADEVQRGRFQLVNAEIVIEAYRYNTSHKEKRGISEIDESFGVGVKAVAPKKKAKGRKTKRNKAKK